MRSAPRVPTRLRLTAVLTAVPSLVVVTATPSGAAPAPWDAARTARTSLTTTGTEYARGAWAEPLSGDGRSAAFAVPVLTPDGYGGSDLRIRDRREGSTRSVSDVPGRRGSDGFENDSAAVSSSGRFIAYRSASTADGTADARVYLRDLQAGAPRLVSLLPDGTAPRCCSTVGGLSGDGGLVAFTVWADDAGGAYTPTAYLRDVAAGTTRRVGGRAEAVDVSADGRRVALVSTGDPAAAGAGRGDLAVYDVAARRSRRVAAATSTQRGPAASLSGDGRYVAFASPSSSLVPGDTNGAVDVFLHDLVGGTTRRVSVSTGEQQARRQDGYGSYVSADAVSADGRYVAFGSSADNLVSGDSNRAHDAFVRDLAAGTTHRVSVSSTGAQTSGTVFAAPFLSAVGRHVAFQTASAIAGDDRNRAVDAHVRHRQ